jgi:mannose-6-phosphate isomerase-like protein (cupin superfamily)
MPLKFAHVGCAVEVGNTVASRAGRRKCWILVTGEERGGAFAMMEFLVPPPHVHHREDEVFYVLEGEFTFTVTGRMIRATAGQTLYGQRDVPHTFKNTGDKTGRMMVVVAPAGLEKFFAEIGTPPRPTLAADAPCRSQCRARDACGNRRLWSKYSNEVCAALLWLAWRGCLTGRQAVPRK